MSKLSDAVKADIQGIVTSAYGHLNYATYLFLQIKDKGQAQAWLQNLLPQVTTASSWRITAGQPKQKPATTLNVVFTAAGLRRLSVSDATLCTFPVEFTEGMTERKRSSILGDIEESAPENWEFGGPHTPEIHLMLMLYAEDETGLTASLQTQREALNATNGGVVEIGSDGGKRIRAEADTYSSREPFGFRDGMGQPQMEGIKGVGQGIIKTGEFIMGYMDEYGMFPITPVVLTAEDPQNILPAYTNPNAKTPYKDLGFNGSYLVHRKLQQDVKGYWEFILQNSHHDAIKALWMAAKFVGRWPSGAPLVLAPAKDDPALGYDDTRNDHFSYMDKDQEGLSCPVGAHIRRTNPRDSILPPNKEESLKVSNRHRILRRAMPFGGDLIFDVGAFDHGQAPAQFDDDGQARGIHFFCINSNIQRQFEFVQQTWVNNPRFNGLNNNRDPLIGDHYPDRDSNYMIIPAHPVRQRTASLPRFVTVRGGAYFFVPSLNALRFLATTR